MKIDVFYEKKINSPFANVMPSRAMKKQARKIILNRYWMVVTASWSSLHNKKIHTIFPVTVSFLVEQKITLLSLFPRCTGRNFVTGLAQKPPVSSTHKHRLARAFLSDSFVHTRREPKAPEQATGRYPSQKI